MIKPFTYVLTASSYVQQPVNWYVGMGAIRRHSMTARGWYIIRLVTKHVSQHVRLALRCITTRRSRSRVHFHDRRSQNLCERKVSVIGASTCDARSSSLHIHS